MTREEAIQSIAFAHGQYMDEVEREVRAIERLCEDKAKTDELLGKIKTLAKQDACLRHKSYVSPYAKFDKIKRKRK